MNEEEFDSSMNSRPFGTADAMRAETQSRRCMALGLALWGKTSEDLQRQLLAPHPEIPPGFDLTDFQKLQETVQVISAASDDPRFAWLPRSILYSPTIFVDAQRFTLWEARTEIVRRAVEYLDGAN
jgi:hypothetical protein